MPAEQMDVPFCEKIIIIIISNFCDRFVKNVSNRLPGGLNEKAIKMMGPELMRLYHDALEVTIGEKPPSTTLLDELYAKPKSRL